jgi:hypothetical protein
MNKRENELLKKRLVVLKVELSNELKSKKSKRTKVAELQKQINTINGWMK